MCRSALGPFLIFLMLTPFLDCFWVDARDFCLPHSSFRCLRPCPPRCLCLRCLLPSSLGLFVALPLSFWLGSQPVMMHGVPAAASECASAGRCYGENSGVIAELNCCSCAPEPFMVSLFWGQVANLLCSGQHCDLLTCQDTPFSRWRALPQFTSS